MKFRDELQRLTGLLWWIICLIHSGRTQDPPTGNASGNTDVTTMFRPLSTSYSDTDRSRMRLCAVTCLYSTSCAGIRMTDTGQCEKQETGDTYLNLPLQSTPDIWAKGCPNGYNGGIYKNQCYKLLSTRYSYANAKIQCEAEGSYIMELIEHEERDAVWNYLKDEGFSNTRFWGGIVQKNPAQRATYRDYHWERSGVELPETIDYWHSRNTPSGNDEQCGYFRTSNPSSGFEDVDCAWAGPNVVCEW